MKLKADLNEIKIHPSSTIEDAIKTLDKVGKKIILVLSQENHLHGVVTDSDIRKALLRGCSISEPINTVMNSNPLVNRLGVNRAQLIAEIDKADIPAVPLVDDRGVVKDIVYGSFVNQKYYHNTTVFILAGGFGTRLRPMTDDCPKPMLQVGERPLLHRVIESFALQGFKKLNISTYYLPHIIEEYFGSGEDFGVSISYVGECEPLGTAGSLGLLDPNEVGDRIIVVNGDVLTNIDFSDVVRFHEEHGSQITMCTKRYPISIPFGVCELDNAKVKGIKEKPTIEYEINTGMYVMSTSVLSLIKSGEYCDMPDLIEQCISKGGLVTRFLFDGYWLDIGSKSDFTQAQNDINQLDS